MLVDRARVAGFRAVGGDRAVFLIEAQARDVLAHVVVVVGAALDTVSEIAIDAGRIGVVRDQSRDERIARRDREDAADGEIEIAVRVVQVGFRIDFEIDAVIELQGVGNGMIVRVADAALARWRRGVGVAGGGHLKIGADVEREPLAEIVGERRHRGRRKEHGGKTDCRRALCQRMAHKNFPLGAKRSARAARYR